MVYLNVIHNLGLMDKNNNGNPRREKAMTVIIDSTGQVHVAKSFSEALKEVEEARSEAAKK
ncbi:MAG: hypothetical protein PHW95_04555 [Patescibacteria group bacterium]|nr:hypothetical protein [Patescibacteria group bacterium]